jgi:phenylpropionate dioxygenase-like ring-hydroxylating dioxygenase large terminal subunit
MPPVTRFFHPVLRAADLRKGQVAGARIDGRGFALFRDASGAAAALDDLCPHRATSLSGAGSVRNGELVCGYHGWTFDAQGHGRCPAQPSLRKCDTRSMQVVERWGYLWLADRGVPESAMPALGWDGFGLAGSISRLFEAPLATVLDNFSEDEHFPTVHAMLGWDASGLPDVTFEAEGFDDRTEVRYAGPQRHHPLLPIFGFKGGDRYHNDWVTRFDPVHAIFTFRIEDPQGRPRPLRVRTAVFLVPETATTTRLHAFVFIAVAAGSLFRLWMPAVRRAALFFGQREIDADARIVRHVRTGASLDGLRLTKFDKPVVLNRKLLRERYYGEPPGRLSVVAEPVV